MLAAQMASEANMDIAAQVALGLVDGFGVEDIARSAGVSVDAVRVIVDDLRSAGAIHPIIAARLLRFERKAFTVRAPWPPLSLTPNTKRRAAHWSDHSGDAKGYRADCKILAREAIGRTIFAYPPHIAIAFFPPDRQHRDDDGMIGAFKAGRDGIADAIRHDDKTWRPAYSFHDPIQRSGAVIVTILPRDGEGGA